MTSSVSPFPAFTVPYLARDQPPGRTHSTPRSETEPLEPGSAAVRTSVLVNTYNHGRFIEDCIESLLVQTVLPDEIIVYDDASRDDTVTRLRRYGSRIILIEGDDHPDRPSYLRQAHAVQTAFARSSGRLVFLLDGDDRFKRDKVKRYLEIFRSNADAALIQAPMDKIDEHGRIIGHNT